MGKSKRRKTLVINRHEVDPNQVWAGHHTYTFDLEKPYIDVWVSALSGCNIHQMVHRDPEKGILEIRFETKVGRVGNRMSAILFTSEE